MNLKPICGRLRISFTDDPDTPVMVYCRSSDGLLSATYYCALESGEIDGEFLTEAEATWLDSWHSRADKWYEEHRILE